MENLHPDFKEFLKLLNSHQVDYLLVGGYAVSIHGYPRYTGDIDGISIPVISLNDLRQNKLASGRAKDLADLENLPPTNIE
jgi:hypothetical protein